MNIFYKITSCLALCFLIGCKSSDNLSAYKLDKEKTVVYSGKTFLFKNYYFTFKDNEATLVYTQDVKIAPQSEPVFLALKENKESRKYQEFTDSSKSIIVKVISENEVRLQLDKTRYTLQNRPIETAGTALESNAILADVDIWKKEHQ